MHVSFLDNTRIPWQTYPCIALCWIRGGRLNAGSYNDCTGFDEKVLLPVSCHKAMKSRAPRQTCIIWSIFLTVSRLGPEGPYSPLAREGLARSRCVLSDEVLDRAPTASLGLLYLEGFV